MKNLKHSAEQGPKSYLSMMRKAIVYPRKGGECRHGWKRIPAICEMYIEKAIDNVLYKSVGIKKMFRANPITFDKVAHDDMNKYIDWQLSRLKAARDKGDFVTYWMIVKYSLKYSKSFRIAAYNKVFSGWWHSINIKKVYKVLRRAEEIIQKYDTMLMYRRAYVEKGSTYRPLGVPFPEWRIVMHMLNNFITMWVRKDLEEWNHGFMPGRGTNTCIRDTVKILNDYKYIYEFDLKQFFPSVVVSDVTNYLINEGTDSTIYRWIDQINRSTPIYQNELKLEETTSFKNHLDKQIEEDKVDLDDPCFEQLKYIPWEEMMKEDGYTDVRLWMKDQLGILDAYNKRKIEKINLEKLYDSSRHLSNKKIVWEPSIENLCNIHKSLMDPTTHLGGLETPCIGLPQGLNTSPILSLIILVKWVHQLKAKGIKVHMYADDGFLYSNVPFEPFSPEKIPFNEEKSQWVKTPEFTKKVKFLGVIIDTENQEITGQTRKGSTLTLGTKGHDLIEMLRELVTCYSTEEAYNWKDDPDLVLLTKSGVHGYVLSRLYQDSWKDKLFEEQPWIHDLNSWLGRRRKCKQHPTKSTEAISFLHLMVSKSMDPKWKAGKRYFKKWRKEHLKEIWTQEEKDRMSYLSEAFMPPSDQVRKNREIWYATMEGEIGKALPPKWIVGKEDKQKELMKSLNTQMEKQWGKDELNSLWYKKSITKS